ncbi:hypothetical protein EVAR_70035_1, partial [Eumeta japonica]
RMESPLPCSRNRWKFTFGWRYERLFGSSMAAAGDEGYLIAECKSLLECIKLERYRSNFFYFRSLPPGERVWRTVSGHRLNSPENTTQWLVPKTVEQKRKISFNIVYCNRNIDTQECGDK